MAQGDEIDVERHDDLLLVRRGTALVAVNFGDTPVRLELEGTLELLACSFEGGCLDGVLQSCAAAWFGLVA